MLRSPPRITAHQHVPVADVGEFVGEDALKLVLIEQLHDLRGDDDHAGALATDREGVGDAHVCHHQPGLLDAHLLAEALGRTVDLVEVVPALGLFGHVLGADATQRHPLPELVLEAHEQQAPDK